MQMATSIAFLIVAFLLVVLVLFGIIRTGLAQLESSIGIQRDGLPPGKVAPSWSSLDLTGHLRTTPAGDHWQLLLFADHSLASFIDVVTGINYLVTVTQDLEVLVLSRESRDLCESTARVLDLEVPIVPVEQTIYDAFRVRVMPFAFLLDAKGIVRWRSLVNREAQLTHAWHTIRSLEQEHSISQEKS
jgi:hypothetical protein